MDYSKLDGLVPAVVQDDRTGEVLMVGFMNDEALEEPGRLPRLLPRRAGAAWARRRGGREPPGGEADPRGLRRGHRPRRSPRGSASPRAGSRTSRLWSTARDVREPARGEADP